MADNTYDTQLTPEEQQRYQDSYYAAKASDDYDMQGYWKDIMQQQGIDPTDPGEDHYPDTYKKPNHMTFSRDSQYSGVDGNEGGDWHLLHDGRFAFQPGPTNLKYHSTQDMVDYFQKVEPNNFLLLGGTGAGPQ